MSVTMVGITHRSADLALLERLVVPEAGRGRLLDALREAGCAEAVVLSTCSRTEIYAVAGLEPRQLVAVLASHCGLSPDELHHAVEARHGLGAVEHLFSVAGGLSSRVIGEMEVQGQVRSALRAAQERGTSGPVTERLFGMALLCGRRVREETPLGAQGRSLARRAVEVGLASLPGDGVQVVVVVGTGKMASVAVEHLTAAGRRPVVVAREPSRAARMAPKAHRRSIDDLVDVLSGADLVICATSAAHDVVTLDHVRTAMTRRDHRHLTLVDLSVPRNIDTSITSIPGIHLVDLEFLDDDASSAPELAAALAAGNAIVASVLRRYAGDVASTSAGPIITAMRTAVAQTCRDELGRLAGRHGLTDDQLARLVHAMTGKLLHRPVLAARAAAAAGDHAALEELSELFSLPPGDQRSSPVPAQLSPQDRESGQGDEHAERHCERRDGDQHPDPYELADRDVDAEPG